MDVSDYLRECLQGLHKTTQSKDYQLRNLQNRKNTMNNFRRDRRTNLMYQKRQINDNMTPICTPETKSANKSVNKTLKSSTNKPNKRLEMLAKWKAEKEERIAQIKMKSKPVFKVFHVPDQVSLPNFNEIKGKPIKKNPTPLKSNIAPSGHVFKPPSNIKPLFMDKGKSTAATSKEAKTEQSRRKLDFRDMTKLSLKTNKAVNLRETRNMTGRTKSVETLMNEKKTTITRETRNRVVKTKSVETSHEKKSNTNVRETRAKTVKTEPIKLKGTATTKSPKSQKKISPTKTKRQKNKVVFIDEKTPSKTAKKRIPKEIRKSTPYKAKGWTVESNEQDSEEDKIDEPQRDEATSDLINFKTPEKSSPKKEAQHEPDLMYISPFVTISRGKSSIRKEYKIRNSVGNVMSPPSLKDDISQCTSPKAGAEYFRRKLNREIHRIEEMCKEWQSIRDSEDIPSEAHDMIDVAIGQSKLLISKKFEQFRGLIQQCKDCEYEEKPITCEDLHGFWDMIYMQVEDLDKRFNNLQKIKSNNWEEVLPEKKTTVQVKRPRGRPPTKKQVTSVLKAMIEAARKKNGNDLTVDSNEQKTFDGGYFAVQSPVKNTPVIKTPSKSGRKSLRLSVLTNEAQKRISSPGITMMKITQSIKSGDGITPSKSILKIDGSRSAKKSVIFKDDVSYEGSRKKSLTHSVLFQDNDELENNMNVTNTGTPVRKSTRLKKI